MSHVRTQIRQAVAALLTGLPSTLARVFVSRPDARPLQAYEIPCLLISRGDVSENTDPIDMAWPGGLMRDFVLVVSCVAAANESLDDALDTMAAEVEAQMGAVTTLGGLIKHISPPTTDSVIDALAEVPAARIDLSYTISYMTFSNAPETAI